MIKVRYYVTMCDSTGVERHHLFRYGELPFVPTSLTDNCSVQIGDVLFALTDCELIDGQNVVNLRVHPYDSEDDDIDDALLAVMNASGWTLVEGV